MSRTKKEGKRRRRPGSSESPGIAAAVMQRHQYGSTERILRRNRKTWTRLANKRRRAEGKKAVEHDCRQVVAGRQDGRST